LIRRGLLAAGAGVPLLALVTVLVLVFRAARSSKGSSVSWAR